MERIQDKYNKSKARVKSVASNPTYMKNVSGVVGAALILLFSAGVFGFMGDSFSSPSWWVMIASETAAMALMIVSVSSMYVEKCRQSSPYKKLSKLLAGKIYCCNDNMDKGTYNGVVCEVNKFNKELCERVWRNALRRVVGSLFTARDDEVEDNEPKLCLSQLNKSFDDFGKFKDEWWDKFFDNKKFNLHQRKRAIEIIAKIRNNQIPVKGLITADAVIYDTYKGSEIISPVYKSSRDVFFGVLQRIGTLLGSAIMLATLTLEQTPDVAGWIWAVVTRIFMIASTIYMAYSLADRVNTKTRNSLHKRINILEDAFNYCELPKSIRANYYYVKGESKEPEGSESD